MHCFLCFLAWETGGLGDRVLSIFLVIPGLGQIAIALLLPFLGLIILTPRAEKRCDRPYQPTT